MEGKSNHFLCSFLCINCEQHAYLPIPSAESHKICKTCELLDEMTCLHCLCSFSILVPNNSRSHSNSLSTLTPSQPVHLPPLNCNTCSTAKSNMKQMKYLKNVCTLCYSIFRARKGLIPLNEFSNMNIQRCSLCHFEKSSKNCQCGLKFCEPCGQKMDCFCYFCDGKCSVCDEFKVIITLSCGHQICEKCFKEFGCCTHCYKLKCENCDKMCDELTKISILGKICSECINEVSMQKPSKNNICKSCKELCESYQTSHCKHDQCIHCDLGGLCLKCRFSSKNTVFLYRGNCTFCNKAGKGQFLYCGHFVCTGCSQTAELRQMNYCCKNCLFSMVKRCVNCNKLGENAWQVNDWKIKKICCRKEICWICCQKNSFFKTCKCKDSI